MKLKTLLEAAKADPYADVDKRNPGIPDSFEVKVGGKTFHVSMSPWMWMRPSQALDKMGFSVALRPHAANAEAHFFHDVPAAKGYLGAKKADVAKVVTDWLKAGGAEALEKKAGDWAKVRADFKKAQAGEDAINAKDDAEAKAAGATHRVDAWVHPRRGGRDRQISWYTEGTPSHDGIKAKLRGMGSMDAGDYKVVAL